MANDTTETTPPTKGTVDLPGIGKVKKKTAIYGIGGAVFGVLAIWWLKQRQAAKKTTTSPATGAVTDPGGNVCTPDQINPQTGYCLGSAQDTQAMSTQSAIQASQGGNFYTGQPFLSGQPIGSGSPIGSPGFFANNAQWAQAVYTALGSTGTDSLGQAVAAYLAGAQLTTNEVGLVEEAIAVEGLPPVAGTGGNPPGLNTGTGTGSGVGNPPPPPASATVPSGLVGGTAGDAHNKIVAAGLVPMADPGQHATDIVTAISPKGGSKVAPGTRVLITASPRTKPRRT